MIQKLVDLPICLDGDRLCRSPWRSSPWCRRSTLPLRPCKGRMIRPGRTSPRHPFRREPCCGSARTTCGRRFITASAFSPDGRFIAAADANAPSPRVVIFDVRTGRQRQADRRAGESGSAVESVAFSPDGTKLLWGEYGGEVAFWDLSGDRLLFREKLHERRVTDVAFSPDGSLMASAGGDVIRLRRVAKPAEVVRNFATRPGPAPGQLDAPKAAAASASQAGKASDAWRSRPTGPGSSREPPAMRRLFIWRIEDGRLLRKIPGAAWQASSQSR